MIHARVEKLKFIVEEMHIAFRLAMHLTDPFIAPTLARHILVRAENFIEHARGLRRPLNDAGYDTRDFHKTKEAYASAFDEYFKVARHRLGAHVQVVSSRPLGGLHFLRASRRVRNNARTQKFFCCDLLGSY